MTRNGGGLAAATITLLSLVVGCGSAADDAPATSRAALADAAVDPGRPNVIWLNIESLRADHIGCYGYERDTTPNLDALASKATVYEQAHTVTSWTLTSHATMFTGLYPSVHGVILPKGRLSSEHETVAETLSACGYDTAAVVSGTYFREAHNLQQGFRTFDDSPITPKGQDVALDRTNDRMERSLTRFLRERRDPSAPFFLFAYFWDPHFHYVPPPPYDSMFVPPDAEPIAPEDVHYSPGFNLGEHISPAQLRYLVAQYDGEIRATDALLGRLFELLRELDLWDDTAIIVTADHGEEFYEHGFNSHKNTLYVESLHVPLVVKYPDQRAPKRDPRQVNLIDLHPTVLDIAGCSSGRPHSGVSLLDEADPDRATYYELTTVWTYPAPGGGKRRESDDWVAIRQGRFKLINVTNKDVWELYDTVEDPGEQSPITHGQEQVVEDLRHEMSAWRDDMALLARECVEGGEAVLTDAEEERLRALGYLP